ncbi:hypothetical protein ACP4OV_010156 [Aristida adscensionis]
MQARWDAKLKASQQAMEEILEADRVRMEQQFQERLRDEEQRQEAERARQDAGLEQALAYIQTLGQAIGQPPPQFLSPPALSQAPYYVTPNQSAASNDGPVNTDMSPSLPPMAPQWTPQWAPRGFVSAFSWPGAAHQPQPTPPPPPPENE